MKLRLIMAALIFAAAFGGQIMAAAPAAATPATPEPTASTTPVEPRVEPTPSEPSTPAEPAPSVIEADWNERPQGVEWSTITGRAIDEVGTGLLETIPEDIAAYCPNYETLDTTGRREFWIGLISAMARFESGFDPSVSFDEYEHCPGEACRRSMTTQDGRHVISRGLLQLSQESANNYSRFGCRVPIAEEETLHNPAVNLRCTVAILNRWVTRDGLISSMQNHGGARYWSVLRPSSPRLARIQAYTSQTQQCRPE